MLWDGHSGYVVSDNVSLVATRATGLVWSSNWPAILSSFLDVVIHLLGFSFLFLSGDWTNSWGSYSDRWHSPQKLRLTLVLPTLSPIQTVRVDRSQSQSRDHCSRILLAHDGWLIMQLLFTCSIHTCGRHIYMTRNSSEPHSMQTRYGIPVTSPSDAIYNFAGNDH